MAITQAVANTFKQQLLQGGHNFNAGSGNVFTLLDFSCVLYFCGSDIRSNTLDE